MTPLRIGVVGPGLNGATASQLSLAEHVGRHLANRGVQLVCGGLFGIMEAACRGAHQSNGTTIGLLPGLNEGDGNSYLTVSLPTGVGELRNGLLINASHSVICIGGSWGTLSEVALTLRSGKTCIGLDAWRISGEDRSLGGRIIHTASPEEAVKLAVDAAVSWRSRDRSDS